MFDENKPDFDDELMDEIEEFEEDDEDEISDDDEDEEDNDEADSDAIEQQANTMTGEGSINSAQVMKNVLLNLSCEIAKVNLSLREILELKIGSTISLPEFPPLVRLKLNDQYIAEGMLVQINGRVGVKIIRK